MYQPNPMGALLLILTRRQQLIEMPSRIGPFLNIIYQNLKYSQKEKRSQYYLVQPLLVREVINECMRKTFQMHTQLFYFLNINNFYIQ